MRSTLSAALCIAVLLTGCKAKEAMDSADIAKDLEKRGTTELMKEVADDEYTPPEDGRLTEAQMKMYLKVREHEKKIAEVAKADLKKQSEKAKGDENSITGFAAGLKALGSAADLVTADIRAASDLGVNTQEYMWVKGQILAASTAAMSETFAASMNANFEKAYADAKKAHAEAQDDTTKTMYAQMLAQYDKTREEMKQNQPQEDPATKHNRELLKKYDQELKAWAHEWSKYEDKPGDAQKAADEMQQQIDGAQQ